MPDEKSLGERNYETFADRYAELASTKPHNALYDRPNILSLLPDVRGLHVLDAGCGPGFYTEWLLASGAIVTAFDVTPRMVEITKERVGNRADVLQHNLNHPLTFLEDDAVDLVICPLVLDYIEDWLPPFREIRRVLKLGGTFVFSCGHPQGDYEWLRRRRGHAVNYFDVEQHTVTWSGFGKPKPEITFYRRPLNEMLNPVVAAGLAIDHILEPLPNDDFKQTAEPRHVEQLMQIPGFLYVRARKP
jgi:SAM-dependent methyltransferase